MIQISENTAKTVVNLLSDVEAVESYAHCSDAFFRNHFKAVVFGSAASAARHEIEAALKAAERSKDPEPEPQEKPAPAKRMKAKSAE